MAPKFSDVPVLSNQMLNEVTIMDFPRVIMVEILVRLPIKSIFRCKIVCKSWYHLLTSDPLSVKMYHQRSSKFPSIFLSINDSVRFPVELKDDNHSQPLYRNIKLSPMFHLPPRIKENLTLIGSCNGFICLMNGWRNHVDNSVYISNPLLGEYFKVKLPEREKRFWHIVYGFCFSEASGQYKVLRFKLLDKDFLDRPKVSELEVYTLGVDEKWRNVGEIPEPLWGSFNNASVNDAFHWMDCEKNDSIYSFNISTEEVKSMSAPRGLETSSNDLTLVELGNCLCLYDNGDGQFIDIWCMKEYGIEESWTKNRILKDSIQVDIRYGRFIPILIWKDGEILMQRFRGTQLVSYDPKEKKFSKVKVYGGYEAIRYIPSFYSLKTVMGESLQVSNTYPKTEIF